MARWSVPFLLALFLGALGAPTLVLVDFHLERAAIERELCIQREVIEEMRTCHGECQLSKRFKALEEKSQAGFPAERVQVRYEPVIDFAPVPKPIFALVTDLVPSDPVFHLSDGFGVRVEHVPRG